MRLIAIGSILTIGLTSSCGSVSAPPPETTDASPTPSPSPSPSPDGGVPPADSQVQDSASTEALEFLSCVSLPATCGASGNDSCCTSLEVVGGSFYRGFDLAGDADSGDMTAPATVGSFRLDKYEVTVGRFRAFVNAGMGIQQTAPAANSGAHAEIFGSGWNPAWNSNLDPDTPTMSANLQCGSPRGAWTAAPGPNENRPISCVTWYEAMAFCIWDGGFLPSEAEWNYAAAGGAEQRAYPWSSPANTLVLDTTHASYNDGTNCIGDGMSGCATTDLLLVGTRPAGDGRWGQSDLAGNVSEWTLDTSPSPYPLPCMSCANVTEGTTTQRVIRGGNFIGLESNLRTTRRNQWGTADRNSDFGVRCARAP